jgi:hypothetical protein
MLHSRTEIYDPNRLLKRIRFDCHEHENDFYGYSGIWVLIIKSLFKKFIKSYIKIFIFKYLFIKFLIVNFIFFSNNHVHSCKYHFY